MDELEDYHANRTTDYTDWQKKRYKQNKSWIN